MSDNLHAVFKPKDAFVYTKADISKVLEGG
jgi:hypothetical protein